MRIRASCNGISLWFGVASFPGHMGDLVPEQRIVPMEMYIYYQNNTITANLDIFWIDCKDHRMVQVKVHTHRSNFTTPTQRGYAYRYEDSLVPRPRGRGEARPGNEASMKTVAHLLYYMRGNRSSHSAARLGRVCCNVYYVKLLASFSGRPSPTLFLTA